MRSARLFLTSSENSFSDSNDHRIIFGLVENVEYNDFKSLIEKTGLLVYMPESNDALYLKKLKLSDAQKKFVEENDVEMIYE